MRFALVAICLGIFAGVPMPSHRKKKAKSQKIRSGALGARYCQTTKASLQPQGWTVSNFD